MILCNVFINSMMSSTNLESGKRLSLNLIPNLWLKNCNFTQKLSSKCLKKYFIQFQTVFLKNPLFYYLCSTELYYLVAKYLEEGPCHRSAQLLKQEIEENRLLPQRFDWTGIQHNSTFQEVDHQNRHITANHLKKIVERINELLDRVSPPSVAGVSSLLGAGRQSLLRDYRTNNSGLNLQPNPCSSLQLSAYRNGAQLLPPTDALSRHPYNLCLSLISRENSGPLTQKQLLPTKYYENYSKFRRLLGHLSSVYCVAFDRTGRYIFTVS